MTYYKTNELYHHGILGQKWYIRRYQNKDGSLTPAGQIRYNKHKDDIIFKKGTRLNNLGSSEKTKLRGSVKTKVISIIPPVIFPVKRKPNETKLFVYKEDNEHDKNVYEGAFSKYVRIRNFEKVLSSNFNFSQIDKINNVFKRKYEATEDLISPSEERRVEIFIDSFRKHPYDYIYGLENANSRLADTSINWAPYLKNLYKDGGFNRKVKDITDDELRKYAYGQFNMLNEWNDMWSTKANNRYYKDLVKQGYNALIDDNNAKKYNDAQEPLIVFDAKKRLKYIGSEKLSDERMDKAYDTVSKYMKEKYNTDVAL